MTFFYHPINLHFFFHFIKQIIKDKNYYNSINQVSLIYDQITINSTDINRSTTTNQQYYDISRVRTDQVINVRRYPCQYRYPLSKLDGRKYEDSKMGIV